MNELLNELFYFDQEGDDQEGASGDSRCFAMAMRELEGFAAKVSDSRDVKSTENMIREGVRAISNALDYIGKVEDFYQFKNEKLGKLLEALLDKIAFVISAKVSVMEVEGRSDARIRGIEAVLERFTGKGGEIWFILNEFFPELLAKVNSFIVELKEAKGLQLDYSFSSYWEKFNVHIRERRTGAKMSKTRAREIAESNFANVRESDFDAIGHPKTEIIAKVAETLKWREEKIDEVMKKMNPDIEV